MKFDKEKAMLAAGKYKLMAEVNRMNAAHSGSAHDGGASKMDAVADAYIQGINNVMPEWIIAIIEQDNEAETADRAEYERLKRKFES